MLPHIDTTWTIFLDRDGVINRRLVDDYVKTETEFEFIENVPEAIAILSKYAGRIIVVTNQQGVGKGLMDETILHKIHDKMKAEIAAKGGRMDAVYFSPHLKHERHITRKPNVGMGLKARKEFPEIRFKKSIMVGDSISDVEFGKRLGMFTVFVSSDKHKISENACLIDETVENLYQFAKQIEVQNAK